MRERGRSQASTGAMRGKLCRLPVNNKTPHGHNITEVQPDHEEGYRSFISQLGAAF